MRLFGLHTRYAQVCQTVFPSAFTLININCNILIYRLHILGTWEGYRQKMLLKICLMKLLRQNVPPNSRCMGKKRKKKLLTKLNTMRLDFMIPNCLMPFFVSILICISMPEWKKALSQLRFEEDYLSRGLKKALSWRKLIFKTF